MSKTRVALPMSRKRTEKVAEDGDQKLVYVERVLLAVDVNNLWHTCQSRFGADARVDFAKLLKKVRKNGYKDVPRKVTAIAYAIDKTIPTSDERKVKAVAYTVIKPRQKMLPDGTPTLEYDSKNSYFLNMLRRVGYVVKSRRMRFSKATGKPSRTDWDVGIAVDAVSDLDQYSTFALASGDGDFIPLLNKLREKEKRVEVYTFQRSASKSLFNACDDLHYLDESFVFLKKDDKEEGEQ